MHVFLRNTIRFLVLLAPKLVLAHVVLDYPAPRTDNDYLYSFEPNVCNFDTASHCRAFCGDPFDTPNAPITKLPVNEPVTIRWRTNVVHPPFRYRIAVNPVAGGDGNFDTNVLAIVSNAQALVSAYAAGVEDNPADGIGITGEFATNVTFPAELADTCGTTPCTVQLYDLYFFVSCANALFAVNDGFVSNNEGDDMVRTPSESPTVATTETIREVPEVDAARTTVDTPQADTPATTNAASNGAESSVTDSGMETSSAGSILHTTVGMFMIGTMGLMIGLLGKLSTH